MLEIALKNGISRSTYYKRLRYGWDKEKAATTPVRKKSKYIELAQKNGLHRSTYYDRLKRGWSKEKAATTPDGRKNKMLELALKNGIKRATYYARVRAGWSEEEAATKPVRKKKYDGEVAVYRGDEFLMIGTIKECAEKLNLTEKAIRHSLTPTAHKENKGNALVSIRLDEED